MCKHLCPRLSAKKPSSAAWQEAGKGEPAACASGCMVSRWVTAFPAGFIGAPSGRQRTELVKMALGKGDPEVREPGTMVSGWLVALPAVFMGMPSGKQPQISRDKPGRGAK